MSLVVTLSNKRKRWDTDDMAPLDSSAMQPKQKYKPPEDSDELPTATVARKEVYMLRLPKYGERPVFNKKRARLMSDVKIVCRDLIIWASKQYLMLRSSFFAERFMAEPLKLLHEIVLPDSWSSSVVKHVITHCYIARSQQTPDIMVTAETYVITNVLGMRNPGNDIEYSISQGRRRKQCDDWLIRIVQAPRLPTGALVEYIKLCYHFRQVDDSLYVPSVGSRAELVKILLPCLAKLMAEPAFVVFMARTPLFAMDLHAAQHGMPLMSSKEWAVVCEREA